MARALVPDEADVPVPGFLRNQQHSTFRRAVAALRRFRGALIAEPVGTGKTYIALALAVVWPSPGTVCFVPASLRRQWVAIAEGIGVPVVVWSHALVSRGRLPPGRFGLAIVDESHHYRNPAIHRYRHLARWLGRRPTLLLTATPIVSRPADLFHQLLLAVRDDALRGAGLPSLRASGAVAAPHPALGHLVIAAAPVGAPDSDRPDTRIRRLPAGHEECTIADEIGRELGKLRLATHRAIADLLRGVFWRALGSSLAALRATVVQYRHLLLHARDATACHRRVSRRALRAFLAGAEAQLVLWPMLPDLEGGIDLTTEDVERLDALLHRLDHHLHRGDPKLIRLIPFINDGAPSLVFVNFVETLHAVRHVPGAAVAWCSGNAAGIGSLRRPREEVLGAFAAPTVPKVAPTTLVTTDVLAEGLNLQRASRVVHFDLPWTAVRLAQRNGRAARSGSRHACIEVVRFEPPPAVEAAVRGEAILARKAEVSRRMGIGDAAQVAWRWRSALAAAFTPGARRGHVARVLASESGILFGAIMHEQRSASTRDRTPPDAGFGTVVWLGEEDWTEDPRAVSARLFEASCGPPAPVPDRSEVDAALVRVAPVLRVLVRRWASGRWAATPRSPLARRLLCRLRALAVRAARMRDTALLTAVDTGLQFAAAGHTAGEELLVETMAVAEDGELLRGLNRLPAVDPARGGVRIELSGLLLFDGGRVADLEHGGD